LITLFNVIYCLKSQFLENLLLPTGAHTKTKTAAAIEIDKQYKHNRVTYCGLKSMYCMFFQLCMQFKRVNCKLQIMLYHTMELEVVPKFSLLLKFSLLFFFSYCITSNPAILPRPRQATVNCNAYGYIA